jgi:Ca-activated chloride channel family protein
MRFLWPELLWLLLLVPMLAAAYVHALRRRRKAAIRYASLMLVREAVAPGQRWRRHVPPALFVLAMTAAILAVARPSAVIVLPSEYLTLVLAIDVSRSMRAADVDPTRISAAQTAARSFIEELPKNVRVAIVTFAGTASIVQTPTDNKDDLLAAIDRFELQRATATGDALVVSLAALFPDEAADLELAVAGSAFSRMGAGVPLDRALREGGAARKEGKTVPPGSYTEGAIILMSDGRRTTGIDPVFAARLAADRGVRVYTVGFGSKDGAVVTAEGWSFFAMLDEDALKAVANITGGEYFHAGTAADLGKIYKSLGTRIAMERRETEVGALLAAASALLLLSAGLLSLLWHYRRA